MKHIKLMLIVGCSLVLQIQAANALRTKFPRLIRSFKIAREDLFPSKTFSLRPINTAPKNKEIIAKEEPWTKKDVAKIGAGLITTLGFSKAVVDYEHSSHINGINKPMDELYLDELNKRYDENRKKYIASNYTADKNTLSLDDQKKELHNDFNNKQLNLKKAQFAYQIALDEAKKGKISLEGLSQLRKELEEAEYFTKENLAQDADLANSPKKQSFLKNYKKAYDYQGSRKEKWYDLYAHTRDMLKTGQFSWNPLNWFKKETPAEKQKKQISDTSYIKNLKKDLELEVSDILGNSAIKNFSPSSLNPAGVALEALQNNTKQLRKPRRDLEDA